MVFSQFHKTGITIELQVFICWRMNCRSYWKDILQGPKGGVPGAQEPRNFCCGAQSPTILLTGALILFWLWSPEPKRILRGAQSPAFSSLIIRVPDCIDSWLLPFCVSLCVNGHKETESEEKTVHNTLGRSQPFSMEGFLMYIACPIDNRVPEALFTRGVWGDAENLIRSVIVSKFINVTKHLANQLLHRDSHKIK